MRSPDTLIKEYGAEIRPLLVDSLNYRCWCGGNIYLCYNRPKRGKCEPKALTMEDYKKMKEGKGKPASPNKKRLLYLVRLIKDQEKKSAEGLQEKEWEVYKKHHEDNVHFADLVGRIVTAYCNTPGMQILNCDDCYEPYFGNSKSKYCSPKCRMAAHRKSKKAND